MNKIMTKWIIVAFVSLLSIVIPLLIWHSDASIKETEKYPLNSYMSKSESSTLNEGKVIKVQNVKVNKNIDNSKLKKECVEEKKDSSFIRKFIIFISIVLLLTSMLLVVYRYFLMKRLKDIPEKGHDLFLHSSNGKEEIRINFVDPLVKITMQNDDDNINPNLSSQEAEIIKKEQSQLPIVFSGDFVSITTEWRVIGASVIGSGHISANLPCQDNNGYAYLGHGWGIAVVSDGAGSASNSQIGSKIVVKRSLFHFSELIQEKNWIEKEMLPSDEDWNEYSFLTLKAVRDDVEMYAEAKDICFKSLSATAIIIVHSPLGILMCHVGDGRAGYRDINGNWHALLNPHKGEEANQTLFITSEFWNIPYYRISNVRVPEASVIREPVKAYVLMSDGCEHACWECNKYDEISKEYFDPNIPASGFFNPILKTICGLNFNIENSQQLLEAWIELLNINPGLIHETDDKTLIVGACQSSIMS